MPQTWVNYVEPPRDFVELWPDTDAGPFIARLRFGYVDGSVAVVAVSLDPADEHDPSAISGAVVRNLRIGAMSQRAIALEADRLVREGEAIYRQSLEDEPLAEFLGGLDPRDDAASSIKLLRAGQPKVGRKRLEDSVLREVASVYSTALLAGMRPNQRVGQHFFITPAAAAQRVREARKRGYLPPTTPGRAKGRPIEGDDSN